MRTVFTVILAAMLVGFGVVACDHEKATETAQDVVCEMVVPVVEVITLKLRAGVTVTAALVTAATGIALSAACEYVIDRLGAAPDEEHTVELESGNGSETMTVSAKTFTSVTEDWCDKTGGCTGFDRCPTSYVCVFTGHEGAGKMSLFKIGFPDLSGQHIDAAAVSVFNRTGKTVTLFDTAGHEGDSYTVAVSTKGNLPEEWQGRARSLTVGPVPTTTSKKTTTSTAPAPTNTTRKPTTTTSTVTTAAPPS
ncbi:peptidase inhibitor family I36 protein [Nocardia ignorata]|uniref:peptidase inhibitor family I36 protein n=1 Tax=Nocardia ignorata TaxID=145285 RepID=UPI0036354423